MALRRITILPGLQIRHYTAEQPYSTHITCYYNISIISHRYQHGLKKMRDAHFILRGRRLMRIRKHK